MGCTGNHRGYVWFSKYEELVRRWTTLAFGKSKFINNNSRFAGIGTKSPLPRVSKRITYQCLVPGDCGRAYNLALMIKLDSHDHDSFSVPNTSNNGIAHPFKRGNGYVLIIYRLVLLFLLC